jgi:hypothetical protein
MSYTGKLTLLNSVIQSLPMYAMCSFKVPVTIFVHFEKSGRQFFGLTENSREMLSKLGHDVQTKGSRWTRNLEPQNTESSPSHEKSAQIL